MKQSNFGASHNSTRGIWNITHRVQNAQFCEKKRKFEPIQFQKENQSEAKLRSSKPKKSSNPIIKLDIQQFPSNALKILEKKNSFKASSMADINCETQNFDDQTPKSDQSGYNIRKGVVPIGPKFQADVPIWLESKKTDDQNPDDQNPKFDQSGYNIRKGVVPIGPKFQADVPIWLESKKTDDDSENLKWLGTKIWQEDGGQKTVDGKRIGKGRQDYCSCLNPGSEKCVKKHINEERILMKYHLGDAFLEMKFDEMGENVSKFWREEDEEKFESLMKNRILKKGKSFLELALESFPSKTKKEIVNYYYNVYIPRRMWKETSSSSLHDVDHQVEK